jgi:protein MpaA
MAAFHGDERESEILVQAFISQYRPEHVVEGKRVAIIPIVNPDGLFRNQRMNARGVDLNRNFPTQDWAELNPDTIYYSGTAAASEPETQFVLQVLETCSPRKIITVHTPYKVINFDGPAEGLAQAMAVPTGYPVVADIGYSTPGSFGTYVGKERHIPTITLELPEEGFDEEALARNLDSLMAGIAYSV